MYTMNNSTLLLDTIEYTLCIPVISSSLLLMLYWSNGNDLCTEHVTQYNSSNNKRETYTKLYFIEQVHAIINESLTSKLITTNLR